MKNLNQYFKLASKNVNQKTEIKTEIDFDSFKSITKSQYKFNFINKGDFLMNSTIIVSLASIVSIFMLASNTKSDTSVYKGENASMRRIIDIDSALAYKLDITNSNIIHFHTETKYLPENPEEMKNFFSYKYDTTRHDGIYTNFRMFLNNFGQLIYAHSWKMYKDWDVSITQNNTPVFLVWERFDEEERNLIQSQYFGRSPYFDEEAMVETYNELNHLKNKLEKNKTYLNETKYLDLSGYQYLNKLIPFRLKNKDEKYNHSIIFFYLPTEEIAEITKLDIKDRFNLIEFNGKSEIIKERKSFIELLGWVEDMEDTLMNKSIEFNKERLTLKLTKDELEKINIFKDDSLYYSITSDQGNQITLKNTCQRTFKVEKHFGGLNEIEKIQPLIKTTNFFIDSARKKMSYSRFIKESSIYKSYIDENNSFRSLVPVEVEISDFDHTNDPAQAVSFGYKVDENGDSTLLHHFNWRKDILWYIANDEFLSALPSRYSKQIKKELGLLDQIDAGEISVDEVCSELEEEKIIDICNIRSDAVKISNIYPNPGADLSNIEIFLTDRRKLTAQIFSMDGNMIKELFNNKEFPAGSTNERIEINDLQTGVYSLVFLSDQNEKVVKQFIKR